MSRSSSVSPLQKRSRRNMTKYDSDSPSFDSTDQPIMLDLPYVVIGGGIAGVSCAIELASMDSKNQVLLISCSDILKQAVGVMEVTKYLQDIAVFEKSSSSIISEHPNLKVMIAFVDFVDSESKIIHCSGGNMIKYHKLSICSGASPQLILSNHPNIIGIRDTESVDILLQKLKQCKNIIIIGNGGIALELVHALTFCDVNWVIKDNYIGSAFFDATAAEFIMPSLLQRARNSRSHYIESTSTQTTTNSSYSTLSGNSSRSYALGPDWDIKTNFTQVMQSYDTDNRNTDLSGSLKVHYNQEVLAVFDTQTNLWTALTIDINISTLPNLREICDGNGNWDFSSNSTISPHKKYSLYIYTSTNQIIGGDFIISATGVKPSTSFLPSNQFKKMDNDDSIVVDDYMMTSVIDVYAAGDCCSYQPKLAENDITNVRNNMWFQMRLWSQAKLQGSYAARCMACDSHDQVEGTFIFELFAHMTRFFGYKVVLLGRYNAQGFEDERMVRNFTINEEEKLRVMKENISMTAECVTDNRNSKSKLELEIWTRITPNKEYIKLVILSGRVVGAMLVGSTELSETFENLILNKINISYLGINVLDPNVDLEDYFD